MEHLAERLAEDILIACAQSHDDQGLALMLYPDPSVALEAAKKLIESARTKQMADVLSFTCHPPQGDRST